MKRLASSRGAIAEPAATRGVMGVPENASEQESNAKFISSDES
jgi:hypothetical protein